MTTNTKSQLVGIAAAANNIPASQVVVQAGDTYYAYDPATGTYWAGMKFTPTPTSADQSAFQDAGAYYLFTKGSTGTWSSVGAGLAGSPCPAIPAAVVALWDWAAGSCHPSSV